MLNISTLLNLLQSQIGNAWSESKRLTINAPISAVPALLVSIPLDARKSMFLYQVSIHQHDTAGNIQIWIQSGGIKVEAPCWIDRETNITHTFFMPLKNNIDIYYTSDTPGELQLCLTYLRYG